MSPDKLFMGRVVRVPVVEGPRRCVRFRRAEVVNWTNEKCDVELVGSRERRWYPHADVKRV